MPQATGVLLDRPDVVAQARSHLEAAGLNDRVRLVTGDFFDEVPAGGDAYLLARILHDWDDDAAVAILDRCRAAMAPGSHLLVVDALLPERADPDSPGAIRMDLHMLVLFGSAERTGNQLTALLDRAGFTVQRIIETHSPAGLGIVEATPLERDPASERTGGTGSVAARLRRFRRRVTRAMLTVSTTTASSPASFRPSPVEDTSNQTLVVVAPVEHGVQYGDGQNAVASPAQEHPDHQPDQAAHDEQRDQRSEPGNRSVKSPMKCSGK